MSESKAGKRVKMQGVEVKKVLEIKYLGSTVKKRGKKESAGRTEE